MASQLTSPRDAPWHSKFALDTFFCLLGLGFATKQLREHLDLGAEGTIKAPKRRQDKMLEDRPALTLVEFQGYFVNSPADDWRSLKYCNMFLMGNKGREKVSVDVFLVP